MMENTVLLTEGNVKLRLQAPTLTVGMHHASSSVTVVEEGTIYWKANAGTVHLTGTCRKQKSNLWYVEMELTNDGPDVEVRAAFPYLFYGFNQETPVRVFHPMFGGVLEPRRAPIRISYPGPGTFCMTAASGLDCAMAIGMFNEEQRHVVIRHIPAGADGQIRFVMERVLVKKGQRVVLPVQFISVGQDWAEAMLPYKEWYAGHYHRIAERPRWWGEGNWSETRNAHCLVPYNPPDAAVGVWIFDNEGKPRTFEQVKAEIDEIAERGEREGFKPLFYQFGWWQAMADIKGLFMFDSLCGDYLKAHELALRVVEYIHEKGLKTYFYTNFISAGDETEVFKNHPELFVRDANGFPVYNEGYPMFMFCPGAPGTRRYWDEILHYFFRVLRVDGIFLDQVCGGTPPHYCYAREHHHEHPDTYGKDFVDLMKYVVQKAKELKPDALVMGELVQDARGILLDEAHGYGYFMPSSPPPASLEEQKATPPAEGYVFTRYLCPGIYSQISHSQDGMMNGAAGHHSDPLWKENRHIFESNVTPCRVEPTGALAYLYGPVEGKAVLAVRSHGDIGLVRVMLPHGVEAEEILTPGIKIEKDGLLTVPAAKNAAYYCLRTVEK